MIRIAVAFIATLLLGPAWAAETCNAYETQFGKFRACVSSVLAPQAGNTYGPEHLNGTTGGGTWCEGVPGPGNGQSITLHHDPRQMIRTLNITNGYAKSDETFRNNGRVRSARIETDRGYRQTITLKDTREPQKIIIPKARIAWVKLTILDVYPGTRHADTCVSEFLTNVEEFANDG